MGPQPALCFHLIMKIPNILAYKTVVFEKHLKQKTTSFDALLFFQNHYSENPEIKEGFLKSD